MGEMMAQHLRRTWWSVSFKSGRYPASKNSKKSSRLVWKPLLSRMPTLFPYVDKSRTLESVEITIMLFRRIAALWNWSS